MNTQQRDAFERCHVVPQDASYNATFGEYRYAEHFGVTHPVNEMFESFCDGARWQAAQQVQGEVEAVAEVIPNVVGVEMAWIDPWNKPPVGSKLYTHPQPAQQVPQWLLEMSQQMREQPNRITAHPFWQVRCKRYLPTLEGYNEHHHEVCGDEGVIWKSTDDLEELHAYLLEEHEDWCIEWAEYERPDAESVDEAVGDYDPKNEDLPDGLTLIPVQEIEEVVTTHLTQADAEWFINRKQHDYPQLYTYVESAYWSPQLRKLQDWIAGLTEKSALLTPTQEPGHE